MTRIFGVALVTLSVVPAWAQGPVPPRPGPVGLPGVPATSTPPERTRVRDTEHAVVVPGCLRGDRLKFSRQSSAVSGGPGGDDRPAAAKALNASEFILEGSRELMSRIRQEHDGHYVEVAGTARVPASPLGADEETSTRKLGPVRVGLGSRVEAGPAPEPPRPIRLKIELLTELAETCVDLHP